MKYSPVIGRVNKMDPIHAKMYLSDFTSPLKSSHIISIDIESQNQLYCQICNKIFTLQLFKLHIQMHKRKPQEKIPSLEYIYSLSNSKVFESNNSQESDLPAIKQVQPRSVVSIGDDCDTIFHLTRDNNEEKAQSEHSGSLNLIKSICPSTQEAKAYRGNEQFMKNNSDVLIKESRPSSSSMKKIKEKKGQSKHFC